MTREDIQQAVELVYKASEPKSLTLKQTLNALEHIRDDINKYGFSYRGNAVLYHQALNNAIERLREVKE